MNSKTDMIPLENPQPAILFSPGGLDQILARIEADARSLVPDISTVKGRSAVASLAAKVAKAKTYLDGLGKDYTSDLKRQTGAVDAERKAMRDRLDALKAEVRRPLDEWEQAEVARVDGIKRRMAELQFSLPSELTSTGYAAQIAALDAITVDESFAEFREEAQQIKDATLYRLGTQRDAAIAREAEAARLAAEAEAARAKAQQEREERIAREAAERAKAEAESFARIEREAAERAAQEAAAKVAAAQEAARIAQEQAKQRAKEAEARAIKDAAFAKARAERAAQDERKRIEVEQRAKEAAYAKRAADAAHRERVHAEIVEDLESAGIDDYDDEVEAIAAGRIRHLRIIY